MKLKRLGCRLHGALLLAALAASVSAFAQTYPTKPVKLIVPFAPGGPTDIVARVISGRFGDAFGQAAIVENRAGAGGNIGIAAAARAAPDGYTLLVVSSAFMVNPTLYAKASYDAIKDFQPITMAGFSANIITAHPTAPATTVKELVAHAKANPGKVSFASAGAGSTPHLAGELFNLAAGLDMTNVAYNGAGPAIQAVLANQTPYAFTAITPAVPLVKAGRLRALAVTTPRRAAALPDVPTLGEMGFPDQETDTVQGVLAPTGTPQTIIARLHVELVKIMQHPDTRARMNEIGFEIVANSPEEYAAIIRAQLERYGKVIRAANLKAD